MVVITTSGTAATELHACVAEAGHAHVPLIVVTADRPPELHGVGAPQTIEQRHLYGAMVRQFEEPGVARMDHALMWRPLARRLWDSSVGRDGYPGPVHLNAAFVEPLIAEALALPAADDGIEAGEAVDRASSDVADFDIAGERVLCVVGPGVTSDAIENCRALNWVVLGDATAAGTLPYFDALLRSKEFSSRVRPDVVVRLGGLPASRVLAEQLRAWDARTVSLRGGGFVADPDQRIQEAYAALPDRTDLRLAGDPTYVATWREASATIGRWLDGLEAAEGALNEPLVARRVVAASSALNVALVVGSSMPVRDVEWWTPSRRAPTYANRGVNGIDGVVSTVLGVASGSRAIGLVGDLTMLHDVSGLVDGLGPAGGSCVLVVVDNRGGGIFSFLPQATVLERDRFEELFGTPRPHNLEAVAGAFGHAATTVTTLDALRNAIDKGLASEGLSVVVASVPSRSENVRLHQAWNDEVARLVAGDGAW